MKPKIIITCLLLLVSAYSRANQEFIRIQQNGHVMMVGNGYGYEDVFKQEFLLFALDKINKEYFNDTAFISVRMSMDSFSYGPRIVPYRQPYYIGYGNQLYSNYEKNTTYTRKAIKLYITQPGFSAMDCLRLIYYALLHRQEIEAKQYPVFIKAHLSEWTINRYSQVSGLSPDCYEMIETIDNEHIEQILGKDYAPLAEYKKYRVYDKWSVNPDNFYLKDDTFYVYHVPDSLWPYKRNTNSYGIANDSNKEQVILKSSRIAYMLSDGHAHDLIFTTTDTCYYYSRKKDTLVGPLYYPEVKYFEGWPHLQVYPELHQRNDSELVLHENRDVGYYHVIYNMRRHTFAVDTTSYNVDAHQWIDGWQRHEQSLARDKAWAEEEKSTQRTHTVMLITLAVMVGIGLMISSRKV